MSYQGVFEKVVLAAVIGAGLPACSTFIPQANQPRVSSSTIDKKAATERKTFAALGSEVNPFSKDVITLGLRGNEPKNTPKIKACFEELSFEKKPFREMTVVNAMRMNECIDRKNIDQFFADPESNRKEIANLVWHRGDKVSTVKLLENDADFAKSAAAYCKDKLKYGVYSFTPCVEDAQDHKTQKEMALMFGGAALALGVFAGGAVMVGRARRDALNKEARGMDAQPS